jgi:hypothetical protein
MSARQDKCYSNAHVCDYIVILTRVQRPSVFFLPKIQKRSEGIHREMGIEQE